MVLEFQLTKLIVGAFSYKAHFRPQISSNETVVGYARYEKLPVNTCNEKPPINTLVKLSFNNYI